MQPRTARGSPVHQNAMRVHSLRRLYERYGIAGTNADYDAMVEQITSGKSPVLGRAHIGSIHLVKVRGCEVFVMWAADVEAIVTVLPRMPNQLRYPSIYAALEGKCLE